MTDATRPKSMSAYYAATADMMREAATAGLDAAVENAIATISAALKQGLPLLVCGNGGSAADAQHITGELVGRFLVERAALNAICLSANPAVLTAWSNDYDYASVFERQVEAHGCKGGVVWGISTSGNSENVIRAMRQGQTMGMTAIGLTGKTGGGMAAVSNVLINVPATVTPHVQEMHICAYHFICEEVERRIA